MLMMSMTSIIKLSDDVSAFKKNVTQVQNNDSDQILRPHNVEMLTYMSHSQSEFVLVEVRAVQLSRLPDA